MFIVAVEEVEDDNDGDNNDSNITVLLFSR